MEAVFQGLTAEEQAATIVRNQSGPPPMNANEKPSTSTLDPAEGETVDPSTEVDDQGRALEADELLEMEERKMRAAELEEEEKLRERTLEELEEMEETDGLTNVNVGKDGLFEVNVKEMKVRTQSSSHDQESWNGFLNGACDAAVLIITGHHSYTDDATNSHLFTSLLMVAVARLLGAS